MLRNLWLLIFFPDMRVTYVFESRFSAGTIYPISMIFDVVNKE